MYIKLSYDKLIDIFSKSNLFLKLLKLLFQCALYVSLKLRPTYVYKDAVKCRLLHSCPILILFSSQLCDCFTHCGARLTAESPGSTTTAATLVVSVAAAIAAIAELATSQIDVTGSMLRADASSSTAARKRLTGPVAWTEMDGLRHSSGDRCRWCLVVIETLPSLLAIHQRGLWRSSLVE